MGLQISVSVKGARNVDLRSGGVSVVGWFSDIVDTVSDAVEDVVDEVGEAAGNAVEAAGDAIDDGLGWVGDHLPGWADAILGWVGGIVAGAFGLVGSAIKAAAGIVGGVIGGLIRIFGGIVSFDGDLIREGFGDIFSSIIGGFALVFLKAVAFGQVIFTVGRERPLTDQEKRNLRRVFKDSLNYYVIRVVEGRAGFFEINDDRFALGNRIYFKKQSVRIEFLVHECTHVWQYQNQGARYLTDNLWAMAWAKNVNAPDVYLDEIIAGNDQWDDMHPEAQAELIEGIWMEGELLSGSMTQRGNAVFYDADGARSRGRFVHKDFDLTDIADAAVARVRDGQTPDWGFW
jgi:hypothetical protein